MWFTNDWFDFRNILDKKTCDEIKESGKSEWEESTIMGSVDKLRESDVCWTDEEWIYKLIWPHMEAANKRSGWNLDIKGAEPMQLTRYEEGGFYTWHRDGISDNIESKNRSDNPLLNGNVRKISLTLVLNDDFEGGDLEFASYSKEKCEITPIKAKVGDMIFFTSGMEHRITPITKGVRYSLVVWFIGPPVR